MEHAQDVCDALANVWGTALPFFLDTIWLNDPIGDPLTIAGVFDYARLIGLRAIPVVRTTYDPAALDAIRDVKDEDGRGCLIRYPVADIGVATAVLNATVNYLQIPRDQVHLMLDYRHHAMDLFAHVPQLPTINDWHTFSAASGACPRSLVNLPPNTWVPVDRHDWTSWLAGVAGGALGRKPAFGDYTVRDPGPPATFGDPVVSLRYTAVSEWLLRTGGKFRQGNSPDIFAICSSLIGRPEYSGAAFSAGDYTINEVAGQREGPGSPQQWLQWAMNHHMTFVVDQIRNHPGI